jgi:hypothetical protein
MKARIYQQGISPVGGLFLASVAGFVLYLVLKLLPHYMDYNGIVKAHEKLAESDPEILNYSLKKLQSRVSLGLLAHQVRTYNEKNTYLDESGDLPVLGFSYQISEHVAGNAFALLKFTHEVEINQEE